MMSQGLDESLHNLPSEGAQGPGALREQRGSSGRCAVAAVLSSAQPSQCWATSREFWAVPGFNLFMESVKRSSQSLKPTPFHQPQQCCGVWTLCCGLIIAFLCLSTPKEPINIGTSIGNVSELLISLFSVSRVALGVVFVLFNHSCAAGLDWLWCSLCIQIKPLAWSRDCLFLWWGEAYFFRYLCWGFFRHWNLYFSLVQWTDRLNPSLCINCHGCEPSRPMWGIILVNKLAKSKGKFHW